MRALRICTEPGCPEPVEQGRCPEHRRQRDRARGSTTARGYGTDHQKERARQLAHAKPTDPCVRCGQPLGPDASALDLDHTDDRHGYRGLAHANCNRGARP